MDKLEIACELAILSSLSYLKENKLNKILVEKEYNVIDIYDGKELTKDTQGFIVIKNDMIIICFRGTELSSLTDIVTDIDGMIRMMNNQSQFSGPINIGNPIEFSIRELAEKILELIPDSKSQLIFKPLPSDDPLQRKPNIDLAKKELNWQPKISLEDGLIKTIQYFRNSFI